MEEEKERVAQFSKEAGCFVEEPKKRGRKPKLVVTESPAGDPQPEKKPRKKRVPKTPKFPDQSYCHTNKPMTIDTVEVLKADIMNLCDRIVDLVRKQAKVSWE